MSRFLPNNDEMHAGMFYIFRHRENGCERVGYVVRISALTRLPMVQFPLCKGRGWTKAKAQNGILNCEYSVLRTAARQEARAAAKHAGVWPDHERYAEGIKWGTF